MPTAEELEKQLTSDRAIAILRTMAGFVKDFGNIPYAYAPSASMAILQACAKNEINLEESDILYQYHEEHAVVV
ncbi:MAG: hypothetical protein HZA34_01120 [Candidatus Pacebacteria bacterium]|nr:hypothetical protein [Candidatus Paceibacterota bacterium]